MDEKIAKTIQVLKTWDEIRQLRENARARGRLDDALKAALRTRSTELGTALIAERTSIDVSDLDPAQAKIVEAISEYVGLAREQGRFPSRTLRQVRSRGLIDAAEAAVCRPKPTKGYETLVDADLEDLSFERIVLDHPEYFSPRASWFARRTLGLTNDSEKPPAPTHGDTQARTTSIIGWLKGGAAGNGDCLPAFSNTDLAALLDMGEMQRFGRVVGNLVSRIDFACYLCTLPPLGCAADEPFGKAWSHQARDWTFPISEMQTAAQSRQWAPSDFDRVLRETEQLPGTAHVSWKEELAKNEESVKAWAMSFRSLSATSEEVAVKRQIRVQNPVWSRDELLLVLELYLAHRGAVPSKDSLQVLDLSDTLNAMGRTLGKAGSGTYRNPNGVYMKMMNFRRFDPDYTSDGKVGLTRGNRDEGVVWLEFANDFGRLQSVCWAIRKILNESTDRPDLSGDDEPDIAEAEEGRLLTRLHRYRERSRKLVALAKKAAMQKYGRLFCQACGFDFGKRYGPTGEGLIDVHHTRPVQTLVEGNITKVDELALLCANCHRVVHSKRKWLSVDDVASLVRLS
jgi:predicted HNH restriction endonuclease